MAHKTYTDYVNVNYKDEDVDAEVIYSVYTGNGGFEPEIEDVRINGAWLDLTNDDHAFFLNALADSAFME